MMVSAYVLPRSSVRLADLIFLLTTTVAVGCVSLDKPKVVQECSAAHTCSDNPNPPVGSDAK